jgi:hypothetical protein
MTWEPFMEELDSWLDVIRATLGSHTEVHHSIHTLSELWDNLQKAAYFYLVWFSCNKFLKTQT